MEITKNNQPGENESELHQMRDLLQYYDRPDLTNADLLILANGQQSQEKSEMVGKETERPVTDAKSDAGAMLSQNSTRWEQTHKQVLETIRVFLKHAGRLPTKTEIAQRTGLSRPTVYAHLKEYESSDEYRTVLRSYHFMAPVIIDTLMARALGGDVRAAKLFLDSLQKIESWKITTAQNVPVVQLHDVRISQELVNKLSLEKQAQLRAIFTQPETEA